MAKGDIHIIGRDARNLISNSKADWFRYNTNATGSGALSGGFSGYLGADRHVAARLGAGDALDAFSRSNLSINRPFPNVDHAFFIDRKKNVVSDNIQHVHKIESAIARQAAIDGRLSFGIYSNVAEQTSQIVISLSYADGIDNFGSFTPFFTSDPFVPGVDLPGVGVDEFGLIKIENVPVPSQAENGILINVQYDSPGATDIIRTRSTAWMCNVGRKLLLYRPMFSDKHEEKDVYLKRFLRKSYNEDTAIGTATSNGIYRWIQGGSAQNAFLPASPDPSMRTQPIGNPYSYVTGAINTVRNDNTLADVVAALSTGGQNQVIFSTTPAVAAGQQLAGHYVLTAEL